MRTRDYKRGRSWNKFGSNSANVVLEYTHKHKKNAVVLKYVQGGRALSDRLAKTQRSAYRRLKNNERHRAPKVLGRSKKSGVLMLEGIQGELLSVQMQKEAGRLDLVEQAGAWLESFHRPTLVERNMPIEKLVQRVDHVVNGTSREVQFQDEFATYFHRFLQDYGRSCTMVVPMARVHGDFHAGNMISNCDAFYGFDFVNFPRKNPVTRDISKFLIESTLSYSPEDQIGKARIVDPAMEEAFFSGYRLIDPNSAVYEFLTKYQVLVGWVVYSGRLRANEDLLSTQLRGGAKRFQDNRRLAASVFG